jgi:beta-1,4-mannosyl-glycoprotein beta-1,4-N-acetylglucosaminyltransferase
MKIYDCFIFYNELDLLKLRLQELDEHVDYFVLVESNQTHSRTPKKLFYEENKEMFSKWNHKIIHVVMDMPEFNFIDKIIIKRQLKKPNKFLSNIALSYGLARMKMDWGQRRAIKNGLTNCKDDDVIMISDLDEIPNPAKVPQAIEMAKEGKIVGFIQRAYCYYLNGRTDTYAIGTKMSTYKTFQEKRGGDPQGFRIPSFKTRLKHKIQRKKGYHGNVWNADVTTIEDAGWHFTFLGGAAAVKKKIESYPHIENYSVNKDANSEKIQKDIENGKHRHLEITYIPIDETFPRTVQDHPEEYFQFIREKNK